MKKLTAFLEKKISDSDLQFDLSIDVEDLYPFNKFEYTITHLINKKIIDIDDYYELRDNYIRRSKYLYLFEISAPRTFGSWGENHLTELEQRLNKPTKKIDDDYSGEYDLYAIDNENYIRIEVKNSRAVDSNSSDSLVKKALAFEDNCSFNMNFQQLKPYCCDVFVWIGVWKDKLLYWVISSDDVLKNKYFSKGQHRGNSSEGQLWITEANINDMEEYRVTGSEIYTKIVECYNESR